MRDIAGYLAAAVVLALLGSAGVGMSRFQRHMADAQEQVATQQYAQANDSLAAAERYLDYTRWVPLMGNGALNEVRARQAALQYWQRQYDAVLPVQAEPVAAVDESNVELQLVVANAAFRVGQTRGKDRESTIQALDEAASGYLTVLKNNVWHEDAAHNYEYTVRLRDEVAKGRGAPKPPEQGGDLGESGAPSPATSLKGFEIYIPLDSTEKTPSGGEAGKSAPKDRKG